MSNLLNNWIFSNTRYFLKFCSFIRILKKKFILILKVINYKKNRGKFINKVNYFLN